jgi:hypothetical protein
MESTHAALVTALPILLCKWCAATIADLQRIVMIEADPVLTAKEVAEDLRCSKSQVYRLMIGDVECVTMLPHLALGRKKVVPRSILERWKRQNLSGMISGDSETDTVDVMH